jgi:hypothetical protein
MKGKGYIVENGYVISEHICQPNPEVPGEFLAPSNYVEIDNVPSCNSDELITYDEVSKTCTIIKNYSGKTVYSKANSKIQKINADIELEEGYTDQQPPDGFLLYTYENEWLPDRDDLIAKALEKNSNEYRIICKETDNEVSKYQKRTELNILYPEDIIDYQNAMKRYSEATLWYKEEKEAILNKTTEELLHYVKNIEDKI